MLIPLHDIQAARHRIADAAVRTPLVRLNAEAPAKIYLKLENLQPIGSFKIRGASNRMALASHEELARGVWTASAGNMRRASRGTHGGCGSRARSWSQRARLRQSSPPSSVWAVAW